MNMTGNSTFRLITSLLTKEHPFETEGDLFYLEGNDGEKRYQAVFKSTFDDSVNLICSLPTITQNIYVTVSDGDPALIRRIVATIEDTERESAVLLGNLLALNDPILRNRNIYGVLFLPASEFNALEGLPSKICTKEKEFKFLAVIFLSKEELEIWEERGHDALIDHFIAVERDIVSFGTEVNIGTPT